MRPMPMRKVLGADMPSPIWPVGVRRIPLAVAQPASLHAILLQAYENGFGTVPDLDAWWSALNGDSEFDPDLLMVAANIDGNPIGFVQSWTSGFIKDLAVQPAWRGRGVGEALLLSSFHAFHERGASHVDLKVVDANTPAIRLYQRLGMEEVPL